MAEMHNPHLARFMAALGRAFEDYGDGVGQAAQASAEAFAASARHLAPDAVQEAYHATCRECGTITAGTWHFVPGGRRFRAPSDHVAPAGGPCPGSYQPADLTEKS